MAKFSSTHFLWYRAPFSGKRYLIWLSLLWCCTQLHVRGGSFPVPQRNSRVLAMRPIIQFRHYIKIASGPTLTWWPPTPLYMTVSNLGFHLCLWPTSWRGGSNDTLLGLNLLDLPSELRNTFCLLDYQFITKEHNLEVPGKDMLRAISERAQNSQALPRHIITKSTVHQQRTSLNQYLLGFCRGLFYRHDWLIHWLS